MTTILQLNASLSPQGQSDQLANRLVAALLAKQPDAKLTVRDLAAQPLPHLDAAEVGAFFTPAESRSAEQQALVAVSDGLVAELAAADVLVLAVPMYNFGIPSTLKAYFDRVARECFTQSMTARGGAVVNIVADIWGSMPGMAHSGAARAGMVSLTETAAMEWASGGVRVNAVAPGYVASSGMDHYPPEAAAMLRQMPKTVPLGRFATEAEVSAGIVFLLSPAASFISGTVLRIDGARPQVRMGWGQVAASADVQQRTAVRPFDGFHRYQPPKVFQ